MQMAILWYQERDHCSIALSRQESLKETLNSIPQTCNLPSSTDLRTGRFAEPNLPLAVNEVPAQFSKGSHFNQ